MDKGGTLLSTTQDTSHIPIYLDIIILWLWLWYGNVPWHLRCPSQIHLKKATRISVMTRSPVEDISVATKQCKPWDHNFRHGETPLDPQLSICLWWLSQLPIDFPINWWFLYGFHVVTSTGGSRNRMRLLPLAALKRFSLFVTGRRLVVLAPENSSTQIDFKKCNNTE